MNKNHGKLDELGNITFAPSVLRVTATNKDGKERKVTICNPSEARFREAGYMPIIDERPPSKEGYTVVPTLYKWANDAHTMIERVYEYRPIVYSAADYDAAMEDYLRSVREARGYTTREPDAYLDSSNARWAQDAKDWIEFRDVCMEYALNVINTFQETGVAPSMGDFIAGFPRIVWEAK